MGSAVVLVLLGLITSKKLLSQVPVSKPIMGSAVIPVLLSAFNLASVVIRCSTFLLLHRHLKSCSITTCRQRSLLPRPSFVRQANHTCHRHLKNCRTTTCR